MRKRVPLYCLVIAVLLLSISLWKNHSYSSEKNRFRQHMLSNSFYSLMDISEDLDALLTAINADSMSYEECENQLIRLSKGFTELHVSLKTFATYFPPYGNSRNSYAGLMDFDFIGRTLVGGRGEVNANPYHGIMFDNTISDEEIRYLMCLKEDLDNLIDLFASKEDPYRMTEDLSVSYIDNALAEFLDKWAFHHEESPFYLLCEP